MILVSSARQAGGQLLNFKSQGGDMNQDPGDPGVGKVRGGGGFFSFKQGGGTDPG